MKADSGILTERIVLGTVQIGVPYGLYSDKPLCSDVEAEAILESAWDIGIRVFDTADAYGLASGRLAKWLGKKSRIAECSVVTKVSKDSCECIDKIKKAVLPFIEARTLSVLTHGYVPKTAWYKFRKICDNLNLRCGQSVYTENEVMEAGLNGADLIQAPGNILNIRNILVGETCAQQMDIRSIFLQGILLASPNEADRRVPGIGRYVQQIQSVAKENSLSLIEFLVISVLHQIPNHWRIVLGAHSQGEILDWGKINEYGQASINKVIDSVRMIDFGQVSSFLTDPRCWEKQKSMT